MQIRDMPNPISDAPILYIPVTESTMVDARALLREPDFIRRFGHGTVVSAGYQTGGRGRLPGRSWVADPDENLLATLILESSRITTGPVPLILGLAVADFLETGFGLRAEVKWPNDVMVRGRKISGILCESRGGYVLAGIGVNIGQPGFPDELAEHACSIMTETGRKPDVAGCLGTLLDAVALRLDDSGWRRSLADRLYGMGRKAWIVTKTEATERRFRGEIAGIGESGGLIVIDDRGMRHEIVSGELVYDRM